MKHLILICCLVCGAGLSSLSCERGFEPFGGDQEKEHENEIGKIWNRVDTADETIAGIRVLFRFDEVSSSFLGNIENLNSKAVSKVRIRVEIHKPHNERTQYGPTIPIDIAPQEKADVVLQAPGHSNFYAFTMELRLG